MPIILSANYLAGPSVWKIYWTRDGWYQVNLDNDWFWMTPRSQHHLQSLPAEVGAPRDTKAPTAVQNTGLPGSSRSTTVGGPFQPGDIIPLVTAADCKAAASADDPFPGFGADGSGCQPDRRLATAEPGATRCFGLQRLPPWTPMLVSGFNSPRAAPAALRSGP